MTLDDGTVIHGTFIYGSLKNLNLGIYYNVDFFYKINDYNEDLEKIIQEIRAINSISISKLDEEITGLDAEIEEAKSQIIEADTIHTRLVLHLQEQHSIKLVLEQMIRAMQDKTITQKEIITKIEELDSVNHKLELKIKEQEEQNELKRAAAKKAAELNSIKVNLEKHIYRIEIDKKIQDIEDKVKSITNNHAKNIESAKTYHDTIERKFEEFKQFEESLAKIYYYDDYVPRKDMDALFGFDSELRMYASLYAKFFQSSKHGKECGNKIIELSKILKMLQTISSDENNASSLLNNYNIPEDSIDEIERTWSWW